MSINPFQAGSQGGQYTDAESRVHAVASFNRAQCEAALKVVGLQKTVNTEIQRRLRKLAKIKTSIRFEDHGQDFLEWDLNATGKVIDCRPFQASVWCDRMVVNHADLRTGDKVVLDNGNNIRYPLVKVQRVKAVKP